MKDGTRAGVTLKNKKEEKVPVTENEEQKFWELGLLGCKSSKSFRHTVLFIVITESYLGLTAVNIEFNCSKFWCWFEFNSFRRKRSETFSR